MNVSDKIRQIRTQKGLSQDYMATQLEIHQSTYSDIENGHSDLKISTLEKIAEILDVDIKIFFGSDSIVYIQNNQENQQVGYINNAHDFEKERILFQELLKYKDDVIKSKDEIIQMQKEMIENLRNK
jgi:transcriptional regulator with XRE-family HTH domain